MAASPAEEMIPVSKVEALISAKVNEARAQDSAKLDAAMQSMMDLISPPSGQGGGGDMRQLAMAIAEISDQGKKSRRVAPEELAKRKDARGRLDTMLHEMKARGEVPEYRVKRKVQLDAGGIIGTFLIEPKWVDPVSKAQKHTTIKFPEIPNEAMEPINEHAKRVFAVFTASIGGVELVNERQRVTPSGVVIVEGHAPRSQSQVGGVQETPTTGLEITGRGQPGEVVQTRVLGTIADPARQVNGRAAA